MIQTVSSFLDKVSHKASYYPKHLLYSSQHSLEKKQYENELTYNWKRLIIDKQILHELQEKLTKQKKLYIPSSLMSSDLSLIDTIKRKRKEANRNNITRTQAYLDFYKRNPEVHWSLLAHLVSRNGGWNMTDLKGSLLSPFFSEERTSDFFLFLEKANSNIFYDAYPQLLLYEESKKKGISFFHLLPYFDVSRFMRPFWDHFLEHKNSKLITIALIINEQHYIENRIVQHPYFKKNVVNTLLFKAQDVFQFTHVFFPYDFDNKVKLAGLSVQDFTNISERIDIGKRLYTLLFGVDTLFNDITSYVERQKHTGSRSDFWPTVFSTTPIEDHYKSMPHFLSKRRKPFIYSPHLQDAWKDVQHTSPSDKDWYQNGANPFSYFSTVDVPQEFEITKTYCLQLHQLTTVTDIQQLIR
ncbi:DUF2515 family protein [Bacillus alkalicellulosilyticus]|uniref:DUF2515 family protein n=1 Tax=Alkalihalobacterium alkalicellulosilyticum TaxID=1912214 RepID=UPI0009967EB9|nr:DUF2515 family protein [Bacillus alkalicellulosilyticus]